MALSSPATIPNIDGENKGAFAIDVLQSQLNDLRKMMEISIIENRRVNSRGSISSIEYERISNKLEKLSNSRSKLEFEIFHKELNKLLREVDEIIMHCEDAIERRMFMYLMERISKVNLESLE